MIIYKKDTGQIIAKVADDQKLDTLYTHYPKEFKQNLGELRCENIPLDLQIDLQNYKVENGRLIRKEESD